MTPASFDESNQVLGRPPGMTDDDCEPLSVWTGDVGGRPVTVSCWKLTRDEQEEFQRTGRIWLWVCGGGMPAVILSAKTPFPATPEDKTEGGGT